MGAISEGARGPLNTRSQCKLKHRPKRLLWLCLEWAHGGATFSCSAAVRGPGSSRAGCALPETPSKQVSGGCRPESWRKSQVKQVFLSAMNSLHLGTMKGGRTRPRGQEARSRGLKVHVLAFCQIFAVAVPGWQWDLSEKSWDLRGPGLVLRD